jgi:hypothetical protein
MYRHYRIQQRSKRIEGDSDPVYRHPVQQMPKKGLPPFMASDGVNVTLGRLPVQQH